MIYWWMLYYKHLNTASRHSSTQEDQKSARIYKQMIFTLICTLKIRIRNSVKMENVLSQPCSVSSNVT